MHATRFYHQSIGREITQLKRDRTKNRKKIVAVNHGGFLPSPIPVVIENLRQADVIVSVAQWVADEYFPNLSQKTPRRIPKNKNKIKSTIMVL